MMEIADLDALLVKIKDCDNVHNFKLSSLKDEPFSRDKYGGGYQVKMQTTNTVGNGRYSQGKHTIKADNLLQLYSRLQKFYSKVLNRYEQE